MAKLQKFRARIGPRVSNVRIDTSPLQYSARTWRQMGEFADQVGSWAYEEGVKRRTREAEEAAQEHTFTRGLVEHELNIDHPDGNGQWTLRDENGAIMPSLPDSDSFSIYDQTLRKAMVVRFAQESETTGMLAMSEMGQAYRNDPRGFAKAADAYRQAFIRELPGDAKKLVGQSLRVKSMEMFRGIEQRNAERVYTETVSIARREFDKSAHDLDMAISNSTNPLELGANGQLDISQSLKAAYKNAMLKLGALYATDAITKGELASRANNISRTMAVRQAMVQEMKGWNDQFAGREEGARDIQQLIDGRMKLIVPKFDFETGKLGSEQVSLANLYTPEERRELAKRYEQSLTSMQYARTQLEGLADAQTERNVNKTAAAVLEAEATGAPMPRPPEVAAGSSPRAKFTAVQTAVTAFNISKTNRLQGAINLVETLSLQGQTFSHTAVLESMPEGLNTKEQARWIDMTSGVQVRNRNAAASAETQLSDRLKLRILEHAMSGEPIDARFEQEVRAELGAATTAKARLEVLGNFNAALKTQATVGRQAAAKQTAERSRTAWARGMTRQSPLKLPELRMYMRNLVDEEGFSEAEAVQIAQSYMAGAAQRDSLENSDAEADVDREALNQLNTMLESNPQATVAMVAKQYVTQNTLNFIANPDQPLEVRANSAKRVLRALLGIKEGLAKTDKVIARVSAHVNAAVAGETLKSSDNALVDDAYITPKLREMGLLEPNETVTPGWWGSNSSAGFQVLGESNYNVLPPSLKRFMQVAVNNLDGQGGPENLATALEYFRRFESTNGGKHALGKGVFFGEALSDWTKLREAADEAGNNLSSVGFMEQWKGLFRGKPRERDALQLMLSPARNLLMEATANYIDNKGWFDKFSAPPDFIRAMATVAAENGEDPTNDTVMEQAYARVMAGGVWGESNGLDYTPNNKQGGSTWMGAGRSKYVTKRPIAKVYEVEHEQGKIAEWAAPHLTRAEHYMSLVLKEDVRLELGKNTTFQYDKMVGDQPTFRVWYKADGKSARPVPMYDAEGKSTGPLVVDFSNQADVYKNGNDVKRQFQKIMQYAATVEMEREAASGSVMNAIPGNSTKQRIRNVVKAIEGDEWKALRIDDFTKERILTKIALEESGYGDLIPPHELKMWREMRVELYQSRPKMMDEAAAKKHRDAVLDVINPIYDKLTKSFRDIPIVTQRRIKDAKARLKARRAEAKAELEAARGNQ